MIRFRKIPDGTKQTHLKNIKAPHFRAGLLSVRRQRTRSVRWRLQTTKKAPRLGCLWRESKAIRSLGISPMASRPAPCALQASLQIFGRGLRTDSLRLLRGAKNSVRSVASPNHKKAPRLGCLWFGCSGLKRCKLEMLKNPCIIRAFGTFLLFFTIVSLAKRHSKADWGTTKYWS